MNRICLLLVCVWFSACARAEKSAPLPGDSVATDGAVSLATPRLASPGTAPASREALSAIESRVFPVDLVMENKATIALTPAQEAAITKELDRTQSELVKLQWELQTEKDKLVKILDEPRIDETKSRQAAEALMQRENAIKGAHLGLLVRIKNVLTPAQQEKLRTARESDRCAPVSGKDAGRD